MISAALPRGRMRLSRSLLNAGVCNLPAEESSCQPPRSAWQGDQSWNRPSRWNRGMLICAPRPHASVMVACMSAHAYRVVGVAPFSLGSQALGNCMQMPQGSVQLACTERPALAAAVVPGLAAWRPVKAARGFVSTCSCVQLQSRCHNPKSHSACMHWSASARSSSCAWPGSLAAYKCRKQHCSTCS